MLVALWAIRHCSVMFNAVSALHSDLQLVVSPEGRVLSCGFRNGVLKKVSWGNSTERGHPRPVPIRRKGPKRTLLPVLRSRIVARGGPIERIRVESRCPVSSGDLHSSFFGKAALDCAKTVLAGTLVLLTWIQGPSQVLAQDTLTTQLSSENPVVGKCDTPHESRYVHLNNSKKDYCRQVLLAVQK